MSQLNSNKLIEAYVQKPEFLTPQQLSTKTGMSLKWVSKHTQAHRIPGQVKFEGRWRYKLEDVDKAADSGIFLLPKTSLKKASPNYFSVRAGRPLWRHNGV